MAYRSSASATGTNATTLTCPVPAGVQANDIVVLLCTCDISSADFTGKFPTGFTMFSQGTVTTDGQKSALGWKRLTGADTGSYTVTIANTGSNWAIAAIAFSGRATASDPAASAANINNTGQASPATVSATGVTALAGDDLCWAGAPDLTLSGATAMTTTPPSGYTLREDASRSFAWAELASQDSVGAGATGTVSGSASWSGGGTAGRIAWLVRIPAASAAAYTLDCTAGTMTVTGTAATVLAARLLSLSPGSTSLTGADAAVLAARILSASAGSAAIAGDNATLLAARLLSLAAASYAITGDDATLVYSALTTYALIADPGAFAITGDPLTLLAARLLSGSPASIAATGLAAGLAAGRTITANPATLTTTGNTATLLAARLLTTAAADYVIAGLAATLRSSGQVSVLIWDQPTPSTGYDAPALAGGYDQPTPSTGWDQP